MEFLEILKNRNAVLFWFGLINLVAFVLLFFLSFYKPIEFAGTNAWHKPIKLALSTFILSWSFGWYTSYLKMGHDLNIVNWLIVVTLAFEVLYIAWQTGKGEASHYILCIFVYVYGSSRFNCHGVGYIGLNALNNRIKLIKTPRSILSFHFQKILILNASLIYN